MNIFLKFKIFCILNFNDKNGDYISKIINVKIMLFDRNYSVCFDLFIGCKNNLCKYGDCCESEFDC